MSELNKMKPQLKSTPAARDLIKRFEPFQPQAVRGDDGRWVVGFGHHAAAKEGVAVSEKEADLLLIYDVLQAEAALDAVLNTPLKPSQRDALVSFVADIGAEAFETSDVARYLFEGRAMAAGEALAIYGDANLERREAENAHFMTSFAPPVSKKAAEREKSTVELVIKVEHPVEETVLETVGAEVAAEAPAKVDPPAAEPVDTAPPPSAAELAARQAAEAEIARILAVVGEIPLDELPTQKDEPPVPATLDVIETQADPVTPEAQTGFEADAEDAGDEDSLAETAPELEAIIELDVPTITDETVDGDEVPADTADEGETSITAEPEKPAPLRKSPPRMILSGPLDAIHGAAPLRRSEPAPQPAPVSVPLDSVLPAEDKAVEAKAETVAEVPAEAPRAEPTKPEPAADAPAKDAAAAQVIARMSQEIEHLPTEETPAEAGRALINTYDQSLPENATLGFVLAGGLATHFAEDAQARSVEDELAELAEAMQEDEGAGEVFGLGALDLDADVEIRGMAGQVEAEDAAGEEKTVVAEPQSEALQDETSEPREPDTDLPDALVAQVHDVVEKEVEKVAQSDNPPPHPAYEPAEAAGAVGEIEAAEREHDEAYAVHHADDLETVSTVSAEERDVLADEFSPSDLVGEEDAFTGQEQVVHKDRSASSFVFATMLSFGFAAVAGVYAFPDIGQMWETGRLTIEAWSFLAGSFVFLFSLWYLISALNDKRK